MSSLDRDINARDTHENINDFLQVYGVNVFVDPQYRKDAAYYSCDAWHQIDAHIRQRESEYDPSGYGDKA